MNQSSGRAAKNIAEIQWRSNEGAEESKDPPVARGFAHLSPEGLPAQCFSAATKPSNV